MTQRGPVVGPELVGLLERSFAVTRAVLAAVPPERWGAGTPCDGWNAGQLGGHLVGGATYFGRCAAGLAPELPTEEPRPLGDEVVADFDEATRLNVEAFGRDGVLSEELPFAFGPTPGWVIANISLSETVLHSWDLARATGLPYSPDESSVDAVLRFQRQSGEEELRADGMFGPAMPVPPGAGPFEELLAFTGRKP
ncbi:TIGR03086 family metal-binding protein [Saccharopolyspora sp. ID03-671]|uniref:TIGR03086 family metal-binding protein n=1 Tax=Saccharopolyspora sp. ID03-671 TaxID=3073066 RepID=UPI003251E3AF